MTIEELLREGLTDLAEDARPGADFLAGVERHIRAERRRRRAVRGAVVMLSIALLAAVGLTVPWLRQIDAGPASPTTITRRNVPAIPIESSWVGKADAQVVLVEGVGPGRRAALERQLGAMPLVARVTYESPAQAEARGGQLFGRPEASLMVKLRDPGAYEELRDALCRGGEFTTGCVEGVNEVRRVLSSAEARARGEAWRRDRTAALAVWGEQIKAMRVGRTVSRAWLSSAVLEVAMTPPIGLVTVVAEARTLDHRRLVLLSYPAVSRRGLEQTCLLILGSRVRERAFVECSETSAADKGEIRVGGTGDGRRWFLAGTAPAGTRQVRVEHRGRPPIVLGVTIVRGFDSAFYLAELPRGGELTDVVAVDAAGRELARATRQ